MENKDISKNIPESGFLKVTKERSVSITPEQRSLLIRKANTLYNNGDIEKAKRIFITTHYSDGLSRIGDYYIKNHRPVDAMKMYMIAPDYSKIEELGEKMAIVLRGWLKNEREENNEHG